MAITIIKEGAKERTTFRAECEECGCVFEYNRDDITFGLWIVRCPQCSHPVPHSSENIVRNATTSPSE